jgi:flagellar protein FliO/FliZ
MKTILLLILSLNLFFVDVHATPAEDLNLELRKELGVEDKKNEKKAEETTPSVEEKNPIKERYGTTEEESGSLLWILVKIAMVFAILTGIFYYALRFLSKNRDSRFPVKGLMRVLSSLPIAGGKEVQILDVGGTLLLIGVSENSISLLKELDSPELKEKVYSAKDSAEPPTDNFVDILLKNFKNTDALKSIVGGISKNASPSEEDVLQEIKSRQIDRLEQMRKDRQDILKKEVDSTNFNNYA